MAKKWKKRQKVVLIVAVAIVVLAGGFVTYSFVTKSFWFKTASPEETAAPVNPTPQVDRQGVFYPGDPK